MNSSDEFEIVALAFYQHAGYLRPGKDAPMSSSPHYEHERQGAWQVWKKAYGGVVRAMLNAVDEIRPTFVEES